MKKEKDPTMQIYNAGANLAIYHIAKAFCVKSADIRASDLKIRDKAKLLAERIFDGIEEKREQEIDRLSAYEDTGLTPEEIMAAANRRHDCKIDCLLEAHNKLLDEIEQFGGIDRFREIVQAEKEGRLEILPPNNPLTLEELREMEGEPVFLPDGDCWALVSFNGFVPIFTWPDEANCSAVDWYNNTGPAYRRKPKEQNHTPDQADAPAWKEHFERRFARGNSTRDILFRGKRMDNGEWEEGWYCKYPLGRWPLRHCIIPSERAESGHLEHIEIDQDSVGRYTGLTDKNGVKIFEGDVLFAGNSTIPLVVKIIDLSWECVRETEGQYYRHRLQTDSSKYEVVGNIFDGKENSK